METGVTLTHCVARKAPFHGLCITVEAKRVHRNLWSCTTFQGSPPPQTSHLTISPRKGILSIVPLLCTQTPAACIVFPCQVQEPIESSQSIGTNLYTRVQNANQVSLMTSFETHHSRNEITREAISSPSRVHNGTIQLRRRQVHRPSSAIPDQ